ncbi:MAG: M20/M25/M40 family metallo-hydrolase [Caldilineaceae bacterium]|nr:M20/M25/M40 family metallo-hydrolase [Caldilineaceae bacterium]
MDRVQAVELLQGLVAIPSVSQHEAAACRWLAEQMVQASYDRAYVDGAGNAVGEMGPDRADHTVVLLGHIDTVPGNIPVRIEETAAGPALFGRGSVDAKGPLATFVAAVARVGSRWLHEHGVRLLVVGAVEEEAATSKGARFIRDRFDGVHAPIPDACIIGEPSDWRRITLGYKGRVLVEIQASQPMAHTAGPEAGVATVAVEFWNWLSDYMERHNRDRARAFDQLLASLRDLRTFTDDAMQDHVIAKTGIRLPPDFDVPAFTAALVAWANTRAGVQALDVALHNPPGEEPIAITVSGSHLTVSLRLSAYEPAWRGDRSNALVRSFLAALRTVAPDEKAGFVVKTGTSDMNVVGPAWRCPIVAYGPGDSSLDHTPHEHLLLDDYWHAVTVLEEALRQVAMQLAAR